MRDALRNIDKMSELLAKRKAERDARDKKYAKKAPALAALIEDAARANGLEVPESTDRPPVDAKGYTERVTVVKMRKVGMLNLVRMLEKIVKSGYPVSISQLKITTRASGPDLYDVTLAVSAFDRKGADNNPEGSAGPKAPQKKSTKGREL
jgi:general secretion pathway protein M